MVRWFISAISICAPLAVLGASARDEPVGYAVVDSYNITKLADGPSGSTLYSLDVEEVGLGTATLLDLRGATRYELGYDHGFLIGQKIVTTIDSLLNYLTGGIEVLNSVMEDILIWQWNIALSLQTPDEYKV